MLKDLSLRAVYDSAECELVQDLIVPLMRESIRYDRGVGFFTSGWLTVAFKGLVELAENEGKARIITSPMISKSDLEAMEKGNDAKNSELLYKILSKAIEDIEKTLQEDPLNALAWLIADGLLEVKFAVPQGKLSGGDFHDKFAIFEDAEGDKVAIHGSFNDSIHGTLNGESFSVFKLWEAGQEEYVRVHENRFFDLWNSQNKMFKVFDIPDAIRKKIIQYRKYDRPYKIKQQNVEGVEHLISDKAIAIKLRDYQEQAISSWEENNRVGIFEMATGTGKTITSLFCAKKVLDDEGVIALVVVVPYLHLISQWNKEMKSLGFNPILCSSENNNWERRVSLKIQDYNLGMIKKFSIVVSHATAATDNFQEKLSQIKKNSTMVIFDEVHGLGSPKMRRALSEHIDFKLGLSATPDRWFDSEGSKKLREYFSKVCFSFSLEDAIEKGFLVPYKYIPHIIEMSEEEFQKYYSLTIIISRLMSQGEEEDSDSKLKSLLRKRSALINKAEGKEVQLIRILEKAVKEGEDISKTLFYCSVGTHKDILRLVASIGIKAREFVYDVANEEREEILRQFSEGFIQAIVAIKCLDEGVDIPVTEKAFILASTTNPREFVQRRGRILRKATGKKEAEIHDFIVVPPLSFEDSESLIEIKRSILKREMPRFAEFSGAAKNEFESRSVIKEVLDQFKLAYLMDYKPWDIYAENRPEDKMDEI